MRELIRRLRLALRAFYCALRHKKNRAARSARIVIPFLLLLM